MWSKGEIETIHELLPNLGKAILSRESLCGLVGRLRRDAARVGKLLAEAYRKEAEAGCWAQEAQAGAAQLRQALEHAIDELDEVGSRSAHRHDCQLHQGWPDTSKPFPMCTCGYWDRVNALRAVLSQPAGQEWVELAKSVLARLREWPGCDTSKCEECQSCRTGVLLARAKVVGWRGNSDV